MREHTSIKWLALLMIVLAASIWGAPVSTAEAQTARLLISPEETIMQLGEVATLDVRVENVNSLWAGQIALRFDPAVVQVVDAAGRPADRIERGDLLNPALVTEYANSADNTLGLVEYAVTLRNNPRNPTSPASGSGSFARVRLKGVGAGTSQVAYSVEGAEYVREIVFVDGELNDFTLPSEDGSVTVEGQMRVFLPIASLSVPEAEWVEDWVHYPGLVEGDSGSVNDRIQTLKAPSHIKCFAFANLTDINMVSWTDQSDSETHYYVERQKDDGSWERVQTVKADDKLYHDDCRDSVGCRASSTTFIDDLNHGHLYRVQAHDSASGTDGPYSATCRAPRYVDSKAEDGSANFRVYYRPFPEAECPKNDGRQACVPAKTDASGKNEMAARIARNLEAARASFVRVGFSDPATYLGGKPMPVDLYPEHQIGLSLVSEFGPGRAARIYLSPAFLGPYDPATDKGEVSSLLTPLHELFHQVQWTYGGLQFDPDQDWAYEGQARSIQDKFCIGDDRARCVSFDQVSRKQRIDYATTVQLHLWSTYTDLTVKSYKAALFWTYVTEYFGKRNEEPERGVDLLVEYWKEAGREWRHSGIGVFNNTVKKMGYANSFYDVFKEFVIADYAKDLVGVQAGRYKYIDETQPHYRDQKPSYSYAGTDYYSYGKVGLELNQPLPADGRIGPMTTKINPRSARYLQVRPAAEAKVITVQVGQAITSTNTLFFALLAVDTDNKLVLEMRRTDTQFSATIPNVGYDRVVVVVAGLRNATVIRYGFSTEWPSFAIYDPVESRPAFAGDPAAPSKIMVKVSVTSPLAGTHPNAFLDFRSMEIAVGGKAVPETDIVASANIQGQYWYIIRPPTQPADGDYDLTVTFAPGLTTDEKDAVRYGPRGQADNVLVLDRSGSMGFYGGAKMNAARDAARLYVDTWRNGDKIGVVSYNEDATVDLSLRDWSATSRTDAITKINALSAGGTTSVGDGLISGLGELTARGNATHPWAIVLLSDGVENEPQYIRDFVTSYDARKAAGQTVPRVHTVALGHDADAARLQKLAADTGGTYHYAGEPPGSSLDASGTIDDGSILATARDLPLELSEIYRVIGETVAVHQQVFSARGALDPFGTVDHTISVDASAAELVVIAKWVPFNMDGPATTLRRPDGSDAGAPTVTYLGHQVWRIPSPTAGNWHLTLGECTHPTHEGCADDYLAEAAVDSALTLEAFLGLAPEERLVGKQMPLLVSISDNLQITDAVVHATITRPDEQTVQLTLHDDGEHGDGAEDDGFYGTRFYDTLQDGGYVVLFTARGNASGGGSFHRRLRTAFSMDAEADDDDDGLPNWWEDEHGTDRDTPDADEDPDDDGLTNDEELRRGTHPRDADSDDGGENDGSEDANGTDPRDPSDDTIEQPIARAFPGIDVVWVRFTPDAAYESVRVVRLDTSAGRRELVADGEPAADGEWIDDNVEYDTEYCYTVQALGDAGLKSAPSNPSCATPRPDPIAPKGWVLINGGDESTLTPNVELTLRAVDNPVPERIGPGSPPFPGDALETGVASVMITNDSTFEVAAWQPFAENVPWVVNPRDDGVATVFVRFIDGAGNVSDTAAASIVVGVAPPAEPAVRLDPPDPVCLDGVVRVPIVVSDVDGLYGAEIHLRFDPERLQVVDEHGDPAFGIVAGEFLDPAQGIVGINSADNTGGYIDYAISLRDPASPASGTGLLATVYFRPLQSGATGVSFEDVKLRRKPVPPAPGAPIPADIQDVTLEVIDCANRGLIGTALLDGRTDHRGAEITVEPGGHRLLSATDGSYSLHGLADGAYEVDIRKSSYLRAGQRTITMANGYVSLPRVVLLGGDCNNSDVIDIRDGAIAGWSFGFTSGQAGFDSRADINGNGTVDIDELVMLGNNFGCAVADTSARCRRWDR